MMTQAQLTDLRQLLSHAIANKSHEQFRILTVAQTSDLLDAAEREAKLREALRRLEDRAGWLAGHGFVGAMPRKEAEQLVLCECRLARAALAKGGAK